MRAAVEVLDRVREAVDVLAVALVPLQCDLDHLAVVFIANENRIVVQRRLRAIEVLHERDDAALVAELVMLLAALVADLDLHAAVEERQFAQSLRERVEVHLGNGEDLRVRFERDQRAATRRFFAFDDLRRRNAALVALAPDESVAMNLELEPLGEEVDDGDADAVQTAGDFVRVVVELTAGVQLGHDDFGCRAAFFFVDVDGDAAAVVVDRHRAVGMDRDGDAIRVTGQRFVDRVVDDLVHHVMEAGDVIGVADVHARTLAHCVESLEDFDVLGRVRAHPAHCCRGGHFAVFVCVIVCHSLVFPSGFGRLLGRLGRVSQRADSRGLTAAKKNAELYYKNPGSGQIFGGSNSPVFND